MGEETTELSWIIGRTKPDTNKAAGRAGEGRAKCYLGAKRPKKPAGFWMFNILIYRKHCLYMQGQEPWEPPFN